MVWIDSKCRRATIFTLFSAATTEQEIWRPYNSTTRVQKETVSKHAKVDGFRHGRRR